MNDDGVPIFSFYTGRGRFLLEPGGPNPKFAAAANPIFPATSLPRRRLPTSPQPLRRRLHLGRMAGHLHFAPNPRNPAIPVH